MVVEGVFHCVDPDRMGPSEMGVGLEDSGLSTGPSDKPRIKSNSIISTDFETAIAKAGFGKFNYFMLLIAIPASCTNAFVSGSMSFVVPVAGPDLGLTPMGKALLQSAPYAGMISSGFFWGVLSDSFGRQRLIAAGFLLDFVMNTLAALIPYLPTVLLFKFLSGFMVCGPYSIFMAYISEVFTDKRRDLAVLSIGTFGCILAILQVCLALVVIPAEPPDWIPLKSWQLFILCCGIPALLTGTACAFSVESPKFLAEKGNSDKALDVCKKIYSINTGLSPDTYPVKKIQKPIGFSESPKRIPVLQKVKAATSVFRPPFINRLAMVFGIQLALAMTLNMIRLWLPEMLTVIANADPEVANQTNTLCPLLVAGHKAQVAGSQVVSGNDVYYNMIILNVCCLVAQLVFTVAVKYIGKKFIIMTVGGISMCCTISIPNISSEYIYIPASLIVAVLAIAFYSQIGLIVEIFPTSVRATSVSMTMLIGRVGVLSGNFLMANLMYSYCDYMFYILSSFCIGIVIICIFLDTTPIDVSIKDKTRIRHETF